jgi:hypothetical protein
MCISLRVFGLFVVTVQPLKSNWKGVPVKDPFQLKKSIEELSRRVWERGRQVGAC